MLFIIIIKWQEEIIQLSEDGSNYATKWDSCKAGLRCGMQAVAGLGKHPWPLLAWLTEQAQRFNTGVVSPLELKAPVTTIA